MMHDWNASAVLESAKFAIMHDLQAHVSLGFGRFLLRINELEAPNPPNLFLICLNLAAIPFCGFDRFNVEYLVMLLNMHDFEVHFFHGSVQDVLKMYSQYDPRLTLEAGQICRYLPKIHDCKGTLCVWSIIQFRIYIHDLEVNSRLDFMDFSLEYILFKSFFRIVFRFSLEMRDFEAHLILDLVQCYFFSLSSDLVDLGRKRIRLRLFFLSWSSLHSSATSNILNSYRQLCQALALGGSSANGPRSVQIISIHHFKQVLRFSKVFSHRLLLFLQIFYCCFS